MSEIARLVYDDEFLCHHGVKEMKWHVRRWQYPDGSLTPEGRIHYGIGPARKPDLDDPYSKANIAEEVEEIRTRGAAAEDRLHKSVIPAYSKKRFFESKAHYKDRHDKAWEEYEQAKKAVQPYREEERDTLRKHQERFELYVDTMDDIDYLFKSGVNLSEADRKEIEAEYKELERAVDRYINADMGYDPDDAPQRREVTYQAYKALENVNRPKDTEKFANKLRTTLEASQAAGRGGLNSIKELNEVDVTAISKAFNNYKQYQAYAIADRIAKELLGNSVDVKVDRKDISGLLYGESLTSARDVVRTYIMERAIAELHSGIDNEFFYFDYDEWRKQNKQS